MDRLHLDATERTPEVDFDYGNNRYMLKGESYPEDVSEFYGQMLQDFEGHLASLKHGEVEFTFELIYFNSSSAKVLIRMFDILEDAASNGSEVHVVWKYEKDDDNMEELGEEIGEDLKAATFTMMPLEV